MKIQNPILQGFHPDPCICRAKDTYFLITSTFEWVPGIALYESTDLVTWKSKGGILKDLNLEGVPDSAGIWAPALSYYEDTFYLIYTICKQIDGCFKDVENYVITAKSIDGPWSPPIFVNASGFDPSIYHEDGKHYILNVQWDSRPLLGHKKFNGVLLQQFDMKQGMIGKESVVYSGSGWGAAEGAHLLKKDRYYYILTAEGGTGRHHSICVARSKNIWGPYEISPYTPMLTSWEKDTPLKKSGHGNMVETDKKEWYLVHLCARYLDKVDMSLLGRETAIQRVQWKKNWPILENGDNKPQLQIECSNSIDRKLTKGYEADFRRSFNLERQEWMTLRHQMEKYLIWKKDGLHMKGGASPTSTFSQAMIARRWESYHFTAGVSVKFRPYHYAQTAGLISYYNTKAFYYFYVGYDENLQMRILNVLSNNNFFFSEPLAGNYIVIPDVVENIFLNMQVDQTELRLFYSFDEGVRQDTRLCLDTTILSDEHVAGWAYTGSVVGITAVDTFNKDTEAVFMQFYQKDTDI